MKSLKFFSFLLLLMLYASSFQAYAQQTYYERLWATYFGDVNLVVADNAMDKDGNVYFVGRVLEGGVFPVTADSHQPTYGGGSSDGFLVKMDPEGQIVWASYYGGEDPDFISGITIDIEDNIFITGNTMSTTGIATPDSYQPQIDGTSDTFVAKFSSDGDRIWSTYYPSTDYSSNNYDTSGIQFQSGVIAADEFGNVYFTNRTDKTDAATSGTFQTEIGQPTNNLISKFSATGELLWATYYGIHLSNVYSIAVVPGAIYVGGENFDCPPQGSYNTYFGTPESHLPEPGGCRNIFISKFTVDGQRIWSTYYGNHYPGWFGKNAIVCFEDAVYFSGLTAGSDHITTPDAYQTQNDDVVPYLVKFNAAGEREWATFVGLNPDRWTQNTIFPAQLNIDSSGNIYLSGGTKSQANISTPGAFQHEKADDRDAFLTIFDPSGQLLYGTYYGGDGQDYGSRPMVYGDSFYLMGHSASEEGIATEGSFQPYYIPNFNSHPDLQTNIFIAKFAPEQMGVEEFHKTGMKVFPNPSNGNFYVRSGKDSVSFVEIYNSLGQQLSGSRITINVQGADISGLTGGLYVVKVTFDSGRSETAKVLVQ